VGGEGELSGPETLQVTTTALGAPPGRSETTLSAEADVCAVATRQPPLGRTAQ
jgi:hypothetical protein